MAQDTRVNIQKVVVFLNTNKPLGRESKKKNVPFKITSKRIKYLQKSLIYDTKEI